MTTDKNYGGFSFSTWERKAVMSLQTNGDRAASNRFRRLPVVFGKVSAFLILLIALVLGPIGMIRLNKVWGWPQWKIPVFQAIGGGLVVCAVTVWFYCSHLFSSDGKGTFFATEPTRQLVTTGLYRYSRNPFYVAHVAFLLGWFLLSGCPTVLLYTGLAIGFIQAVIIWWEEAGLRKRFGEDYARYTQAVPRWLFIRSCRT
jgi:protein-S-isoprenylcysteine O-methyltransferase Ste14